MGWRSHGLNIKEYNNNVTFVLVVIDVFNRYAYLRPLKSKRKPDVLVAFKSILNESDFFPRNFQNRSRPRIYE